MERGYGRANGGGKSQEKGKDKARPRPRQPMSREVAFHKNKARAREEAQARLRNAGGPSSFSTTPVASTSKALESTRKIFENPHPYRYKSFNDRLASVHIGASSSLTSGRGSTMAGLDVQGVAPSAPVTDIDDDFDDYDEEARMAILLASTAFGSALLTWRELNLTVPFQKLLREITSRSQSLPQLIHHRSHIVSALSSTLRSKSSDAHLAYEPALDLFPRLALDLGSEFLPVYPEALEAMLQTTMISKNATGGDEKMAARLVEKAFEMVAALFRNVAPLIVKGQGGRDWLQETWGIVRPYLGYSACAMDVDDEQEEEESPEDDNAVSSNSKPSPPRIPSHVRRFAAEAFAHLLRRAKQPQLVQSAAFMLSDVEEVLSSASAGREEEEQGHGRSSGAFASGVAGIWLEVVKSVDRRLHSQAVPQITALVFRSDVAPSQAQTVVGKLLFTALVHHGQAAHLAPVFELLIQTADERLSACQAEPSAKTQEALLQSLVWLIAALGTRKGNRVDESAKTPLFALLLGLVQTFADSKDSAMSSALTVLLSLTLPIGRIPDLVGPGIRIVDILTKGRGENGALSQAFVACVLALADPSIAWPGFKQCVLPQVLTATMQAAGSSSSPSAKDAAFRLLNDLSKSGQLDSIAQDNSNESPKIARWRTTVGSELGHRLDRLAELIASPHSAEVTQELERLVPALGLVKLFARTEYAESIAESIRSGVASLLTSALSSTDEVETRFNASVSNSLAVLGSLLSALASMVSEATNQARAHELIGGITNNSQLVAAVTQLLPQHRYALSAAVEIFTIASAKSATRQGVLPPPEECVQNFWPSLMAEDEDLRRASAQWLTLCGHNAAVENQELSELYSLISKIEDIPLRVETVRDRNVRLRSLVRELLRLAAHSDTESDARRTTQLEMTAKTVCRYVVSTLKLNFKPLWEEARKALADMSGRYAALVWEVAFEELTASRGPKMLPSSWLAEDGCQRAVSYPALQDDLDEDSADEHNKAFRDPQRTQRTALILGIWEKASQEVASQTRQVLKELQAPAGRLDVANYHGQILILFSEQPAMVEKHNAAFVQHFFSTVVDDDAQRRGGDAADIDDEMEDKSSSREVKQSSNVASLSLRQRQERVHSYLEVFNKFSNPKALFRSSGLHEYFYSLMAQGESKIQTLALQCVLTWKDPAQLKYEERMFRLLDQSKFRDELTSFDLALGGQAIQEEHRASLMPLLIRLLFGSIVSKKGRSSASTSGAGRKVAILNALSGCSSAELGILVDLMLGPFQDQVPDVQGSKMAISQTPPQAFLRQQNGLLSLLADVVKHLGAQLIAHWSRLVGVTINLAHHSSARAAEQGPGKASAVSRDVRQAAIRRLADFFKCPASPQFDWTAYMPVIFSSLVSPRLELFSSENTQSPSALLELFNIWSAKQQFLPLLVKGDQRVLPSLYSCLAVPTVKNPVVVPILDIVERILDSAEDASEDNQSGIDVTQAKMVKDEVLRPFISSLVSSLSPLLQRTSSAAQPDHILQRAIGLLSRIAVFVEKSDDATLVLDLLGPMLRKSNRVVPEKSKTELLSTFRDLLLLTDTFKDPQSDIFTRHYELFSSMWSTLRSRAARQSLGTVFKQIALVDGSLGRVAGWVEALNAFSVRRLDEVDFDQRLDVFDALTSKGEELTPREWLPILHNMIFFIQDGEELVIRSNASAVLRSYVQAVADEKEEGPLRSLFTRIVYPALRKTLRSRSEPVRREVVSVIGAAVKDLPHVAALSEMQGLLAAGDEEANFFNNIHHIQLHRRSRALRRLAEHAEGGELRSKSISEVFLPLIGHFLEAGHTEIGDHNLANETLSCIGRLTRQLQWGSYNALLWKYLRLADGKSAGEKIYVRAAMAILDNFHFGMEDVVPAEEEAVEDQEDAEVDGAVEDEAAVAARAQEAAAEKEKHAAQSQKIVTSVTAKLLPALMGYLEHHDDETDDALRLPIAVGVVTVVECLPSAEKEVQLGKLLSVLANVFRSKSQETRDLARETLCKIAVALGAERLPQIVKELRRALTRGPQLAILAYNIHSILVHLMQHEASPLTYLDRGVEDMIAIAGEDLFGHTSEDREATDYKIKAREMRQSKSLDTFEQLAKIIAPHCINALLAPLKTIMEQTEAPRSMKAVEDALRRTASGINSNGHFDYTSLLGLCHSTITSNSSFLKARAGAAKGQGSAPKQDVLLMKRKDVEAGVSVRDHYAANAYRFVAFGLDLLVTALRRSRFDFADKEVLGRLDPLVNAVGNTLYAADTHVVTLGLRATGALLRCPLPSIEASLPVLTRQTLSVINREANPAADASQAGLRTVTIILRDCPKADFKEKQLADLLALTLPEIEEPAAQSSIFGLLRAIIGRRFVVPEVYEAMDKVAEMMVTNQSSQVREISRAAFLQFLLDYPQGKGRLRNQMEFLAKNLSYVYESGRLSVMDLLAAVLAKFSDDVLADYGQLLFVGLVMVLANDDSSKCREKAAELTRTLIGLISEEKRAGLIQMAHAWAESTERADLSRVGVQVYGLFLEAVPDEASSWTPKAMRVLRGVIISCADDLEELEHADEFAAMDMDLDWQLPYHALQAISKLSKVEPALLAGSGKDVCSTWSAIRRLLLFPHAWVRIASCRLIGSLFATTQPVQPTHSSGGVKAAAALDPLSLEALIESSRKLALQLRGDVVDDALGLQIVKNLLWIGRSFASVPVSERETNGKAKKKRASTVEAEQDGETDEEGSEVDSEADDEDDEAAAAEKDSDALENPLAWLFTKLSYQARKVQGGHATADNPAGVATESSTAILRWFAAMAQHLSVSRLQTFLPHIVTPLFRLMDDETLRGPRVEALKTLASEVQELLTEKVGTTNYAAVYSRVRSRALDRRRERRNKRLLQGVADPEGAAKRKEKRNEGKHESRKRKNRVFADGKGRMKGAGQGSKRSRRDG
ncbi:hypothetical protein BCV69DRAFT_281764 [Microstroma glucosiphilum]|uniref:Uncharacterized protein n=1 Tax=Pseudomicrostroma glucosiphilum TaxID=1684307 RepID=A0A316U9E2_9BASI|nr:hypothetical protein BCV69DRAFT_281764 [Pseudomicrostroma glucosiphilum]PWN21850.1 hypothetical protein BCV69DRAFT_281764 [Pseudomicrostroma glucosiphilum]